MINTTFSLTEMQHFVRAAVAVSSSMVGFRFFLELYVFNAACKVMRQWTFLYGDSGTDYITSLCHPDPVGKVQRKRLFRNSWQLECMFKIAQIWTAKCHVDIVASI